MKLGCKQKKILRILKRGPLNSGDLWECFADSRYSETRLSQMLCRLEELGMVQDNGRYQNAITERGLAELEVKQ